ncbi:hypothetical protein L6259_02655 [Candidatus Parcubacteria bacterium]|nr:hypothetical protein [Patescibacteria group bacterium]MCG2694146.1 hypothetical protein [Candidatus Parcubacteria bacterium]
MKKAIGVLMFLSLLVGAMFGLLTSSGDIDAPYQYLPFIPNFFVRMPCVIILITSLIGGLIGFVALAVHLITSKESKKTEEPSTEEKD